MLGVVVEGVIGGQAHGGGDLLIVEAFAIGGYREVLHQLAEVGELSLGVGTGSAYRSEHILTVIWSEYSSEFMGRDLGVGAAGHEQRGRLLLGLLRDL